MAQATAQDLSLRGESHSATEQRKARKRELDRLAQQKKRKNDRDTISMLRAQVKALEQQSDGNQMYNLIVKQEKDQWILKRHLERMKRIESLVQEDLKDLSEDDLAVPRSRINNVTSEAEHSVTTPIEVSTVPHTSKSSFTTERSVVNQRFDEHQGSHLDAMTWDELTDGAQIFPNDGSDLPGAEHEEYMDLEGIPLFSESFAKSTSSNLLLAMSPPPQKNPGLNWAQPANMPLVGPQRWQDQDSHRCDSMWSICNSAIVRCQALLLYSAETSHYDDNDAHMIITAITKGWAKAAKSQFWNGQWESLRQIDHFCHSMCKPIERMATLYILSRLFRVRVRHRIAGLLLT